jgi:hypothetical protein
VTPDAHRAVELIMTRTRVTADGCLAWTGARNEAGYPYVAVDTPDGRRMLGAHRYVYASLVGHLAPGEHVHHRCGVRSCVHPAHLQRATARANVGEMLARRGYEARIRHLEDALGEAVAEAVADLRAIIDAQADRIAELESSA